MTALQFILLEYQSLTIVHCFYRLLSSSTSIAKRVSICFPLLTLSGGGSCVSTAPQAMIELKAGELGDNVLWTRGLTVVLAVRSLHLFDVGLSPLSDFHLPMSVFPSRAIFAMTLTRILFLCFFFLFQRSVYDCALKQSYGCVFIL